MPRGSATRSGSPSAGTSSGTFTWFGRGRTRGGGFTTCLCVGENSSRLKVRSRERLLAASIFSRLSDLASGNRHEADVDRLDVDRGRALVAGIGADDEPQVALCVGADAGRVDVGLAHRLVVGLGPGEVATDPV